MSAIEWTDETWNPTVGCTKVSPGCKNCYAEKMHARLTAMGRGKYAAPFTTVMHHSASLDAPLHWRKPRRVFVNSMSDLFHKDVPLEFVARVFTVMARASRHTFQVLTKRADAMRAFVPEFYRVDRLGEESFDGWKSPGRPLPNVWLGVSVEDQERADHRIPHLLQTPAAVRFLSCEPLLGPVKIPVTWLTYAGTKQWVICGAESGPGARPIDLAWARSLRDQCAEAGVPFFMKQLCRNGKKIPFDEWPEDLKVRQYPE